VSPPTATGSSTRRRLPIAARCAIAAAVGVAVGIAGGAVPAGAAPPAYGDCPTVAGAPPAGEGQGEVDAATIQLREGMQIESDQLLMLRELLPPVIWQHREAFFYEGMRMEIGGCHRRYPSFGPYRRATEELAGKVRLDRDGNLLHYRAGLPFPPESIDPDDEQAAAKWAWNLEQRHRGAGFRGSFRITEIPARIGGILTFEGKLFFVQTSQRADLADSNFSFGDHPDMLWAAGGRFLRPFDARHLAWRQFRSFKSQHEYDEPDDMFVYVPAMRKQRRAATGWVDGLYVPTYTGGAEGAGGGMALGDARGAISPTAGLSITVSEDKGHGLTGLSLRPNAYLWRYRGERTVLAPLNGSRDGYPAEPKRNYGTSGLSVASDRWDVRYAVIIEGAIRTSGSGVRAVEIWVDYQTQHPLYWITRGGRRRLQDIGVLVHRFSGDRNHYPEWPGGIPANVFEPVAASFYDAMAGGGGWRRESYDLVSTPFDEAERRVMTSADNLGKGR
jgi:hypothetical protein